MLYTSVHQPNLHLYTGQASHSTIQAALLIGHGTKDMFNGSVFGELSGLAGSPTTITDLIFDVVIADVIQMLKDQNLEHQH